MYIVELCNLTRGELDELPERLLHDMLVYKAIKQVTENGGTYQP